MFPPGAYLSHILNVPLIAFSMVSIPPMNEVLFGIEEPANEVSAENDSYKVPHSLSVVNHY